MAVGWLLASNHFPYLPFRIEIGAWTSQLEALLDTGFEGDLALPDSMLDSRQRPQGYIPWVLADGSYVLAPTHMGTLHLGRAAPIPVDVTVLGNQPIVGRGISDRFNVVLDHGRELRVEP